METNPYTNRWYLVKMDEWDEEFFNMDGIQIDAEGGGRFEFGAVQSELDGKAVKVGRVERFEFSFQGFDEAEQVSGCGWITLKEDDIIEGEIRFFQGDNLGFVAEKQ